MQKKLIALAVAGLVSGGAFAQSNVTLYGIVDAGIEIGNSGFGSKTRIQTGQSAGNRLGFKGEEALGGGTSAMFQLETGFALDNGQLSNNSSHLGATSAGAGATNGINTGSAAGVAQTSGAGLFQRTAIAGLKGGWGQVTVGRQYAPEFLVTAAVDPFAAGLGGNNGVVLGGAGFAQRLDNSVMYVSPNMSGFTGGIGYSSGFENNTNTESIAGGAVCPAAPAAATACTNDKAGKAWVLLATYANGPAYFGIGYHNVNGATYDSFTTSNQTGLSKAKSWLAGASWNFGVVKLSGTYFTGNTDQPGTTNGTNAAAAAATSLITVGKVQDVRAYTLGLQAPMGPWTFNAVYGKRDDKTINDKDFSSFSFGGEYAMSKRTAFYAAYTKFSNKQGNMNAAQIAAGTQLPGSAVINSALNTGLSLQNQDYDPNALQLGMRHSF